LGIATFAAGFLVPNGSIVVLGLPLAAFALGWITYRYGVRTSTALAIAASLPVAFFGQSVLGVSPLDAVYVAVALLAVGPGAAVALRRYSAFTVVAAVAAVVAVAFLVAPVGNQTLLGSLDFTRVFWNALASSGSIKDPAAFRATIPAAIAQVRMAWPSTVFYTMGLGALASIPLVGRAARMQDQVVNRYPALADLDLTFHVVWPAIAGLALVAAGTLWGKSQGPVYAVGYNTLIIVRPALALQGLATFAALYRRVGAGRVWRTIGYVLLVATEFLLPSVSVLGVADLFFNFRKLPRHQGSLTNTPL
jgi:hypothetical protein